MSAYRHIFFAAMLAALTACAGAFIPAQPKLYTLTPKAVIDPALPRANFQLLVETPLASAALDTPRIAVGKTETSIDYLAEASWTDRAPAMLQGLIVQSFEDSRKILSVGRDTVGLRSDFVLRTELRDFQAEYSTPTAGNPDRVRIRLAAKLVAMPRRSIEAGETFEAVVPVQDGGLSGVVTAFDTALEQVMQQLVAWTLRTGASIGGAGNGAVRRGSSP